VLRSGGTQPADDHKPPFWAACECQDRDGGNDSNRRLLLWSCTTTDRGQLIDIDPLANGGIGSARVVATPGTGFDGVSVNAAGTQAIIENGGPIQVYDSATGAFAPQLMPRQFA